MSQISCVPKKNGKFRLVTDLRHINKQSIPPKIKYEDINTVISVVKPKDYIVTSDLQNGFFHVPVHKDHQTLLGFKFRSEYYIWTVLPFGHNCSPYFFSKVLRPVITHLRSCGLRLVLYVDDFVLFAPRDAILTHKFLLISTLEKLGWIINFEKSSLEPSLTKEFIGYLIDNTGDKTVISIPRKRITKVRKDINRCLSKGSISARGLARIGGQCVSMYKCVFPAKLQLRNLYRLLATKISWSDILRLDQPTIDDLNWWYASLTKWNGLVVQETHIDVQMTTDASSIAWGAWIPGHNAQGFWNKAMSFRHSNYRELSAVWLGLISLREFLRNKTVQICSDNITTIAFINQMGGSIKELDLVARQIHQQAIDMNTKIIATYISGVQNWQADQLSRLESTYEWKLHPNLFHLIDNYWGPHDRQVCVNDDSANSNLQQFILGSTNKRSGCTGSEGLEILQQLRKCSIRFDTQSSGHCGTTTSFSYNNSTLLAGSSMVPKVKITSDRQPNSPSGIPKNGSQDRPTRRTSEKQEMATVRLENLWKTRLRCLGWSKRAASQSKHSLAQSTIKTYNNYINKYVEFCQSKNVDFSDENNSNVLADFLCNLSDRSDRPESSVKTCSAALNCMFEAMGKGSPVNDPNIKRLVTGIIKSGTVAPMKRSQPIPINSFVDLFHTWGKNEEMSIKQLRMKSVTLIALVCMTSQTRPSDLAPRGINFNSKDLSIHNIVLSLDNVQFLPDNSLTIHFFVIKNDTSRTGFEVNIPPNTEDIIMDPVSCLREYINRTATFRPMDTKPLFITLSAPYKAISSNTVSNILEEVIRLAGLAGKGFKAKPFRPTGATLAVAKGIIPETVMQVGRWKTKEVFMNHYVYPRPPETFTSSLFT